MIMKLMNQVYSHRRKGWTSPQELGVTNGSVYRSDGEWKYLLGDWTDGKKRDRNRWWIEYRAPGYREKAK